MRAFHFLFATVLIVTPALATTTVLHDETLDGDLPLTVSSKDFGLLGTGSYLITGTLDGGTQSGGNDERPDESDGFIFKTQGPWSLDITALAGVNAAITVRPGIAFGQLVVAPQDGLLTDISAGSYAFLIAPENNVGTLSYGLRINVVPEPHTLALVGAAMSLFICRRRRSTIR